MIWAWIGGGLVVAVLVMLGLAALAVRGLGDVGLLPEEPDE